MDAYEHVASLVPSHDDRPAVVAVTGPVAVGKTESARALGAALAPRRVATVSTDGFLMTNAELVSSGQLMQKGHPSTYAVDALVGLVTEVRAGRGAAAPRYSHLFYDRVPGETRVGPDVDVLVLEGLHLLHDVFEPVRDLVDLTVYLDASDADLERWYAERFCVLVAEAREEPNAFDLFRSLDAESCDSVAREVWRSLNLPNVERFVRPTRERADVVLEKGPDHTILRVAERP